MDERSHVEYRKAFGRVGHRKNGTLRQDAWHSASAKRLVGF